MVISMIGLSSSGKSTIASKIYERLNRNHSNTVIVDGDALRQAIAPDLGHTFEDRRESEARGSRLCKVLNDQGINVICAGLSNNPEWRSWCRENIPSYFEVYLEVPIQTLIERDKKDIYKQALEGKMKNVVGIDIKFSPPENPDLIIDNLGIFTEEEVVDKIWDALPLL